jgi:acyl-CoA thioester hydrolase
MPDTKPIETYRGVVHPWLCDALGHLTTRNYVAMFDDAGWHLLLALGFSPGRMMREKLGWADVRHEIEYVHELTEGELVLVRSSPVKVGNKSLTYKHEMSNAESSVVCASMVATAVYFDLKERKAIPIDDAMRQQIEAWLAAAR